MIVYISMTIISMLCAKYAMNVREEKTLQKTYRILAFGSFLPFFLISALRYRVGTDYMIIYENYFAAINNGEYQFSEPGFNLINRIAYFIAHDSAMMFAIVALIILCFVFLAIYEQSVNVCFSILYFVVSAIFFNSLNQLRQAISMAIFLYALKYIWKQDLKRYLMFIGFAMLMHTSAALYIPVYFLYRFRANLKVHIWIFAGSIVSLPVIIKTLEFFISFTKYESYFGSKHDLKNFSLIEFVFNLVILAVAYYYFYYYEDNQDRTYHFMLNMQFISVLVLLFSSAIPQVTRVSNCFSYVGILFIPKIIEREYYANRRIVLYMGCTGFYLSKLLYDIYINNWYYVLPYKTLFSR